MTGNSPIEPAAMVIPVSPRSIRLRGVHVNNLKGIDLDIPHGQLLCLCGLSGSGKTSLALDTLFAEGQRRFIECFSPYTRQFLKQWDKPNADRIDGIPPAIAVTATRGKGSSRTTIGGATETVEYLKLLFSRVGMPVCPDCDLPVRVYSPQSIAAELNQREIGTRIQIIFPIQCPSLQDFESKIEELRASGFRRLIAMGGSHDIDNAGQLALDFSLDQQPMWVVVDRLVVDSSVQKRMIESLETAMRHGSGSVIVLTESISAGTTEIDGRRFDVWRFQNRLVCVNCNRKFQPAEPNLFSHNSPQGACPGCQGVGYMPYSDIDKILPDQDKSIRQGAIAPWNTPAYLARWRSLKACESCHGMRLNPTALAWKIADHNIAELTRLPIAELKHWLTISFPVNGEPVDGVLNNLLQRLGYLIDSGLSYLSLDRPMSSLGTGERQRVALTRALGSALVNLLYVLDEPSSGLHPFDIEKLIRQIQRLQSRRNTIVMVEHNPRLIQIADRVVEIGPAAGEAGGEIVFDGSPAALIRDGSTATGAYLSGERGWAIPIDRRVRTRGSLRLMGARGNNLKSIDVTFPLGVLCVVTGVSGSGKSSLVRQTLAPAMQQLTGNSGSDSPLPFDELRGSDLIDEVVLIDRQSLIKTSRSNPATYIKAFDEIRNVFATTADARARGMKPGHFSFNVAGGRCETCHGEGFLRIDMQFMADVLKRCDECQGTRFQPGVQEVRFRDRSISEVLNMTVEKAFGFFRGHKKVQKRLKLLKDAGLDYMNLGQPLSTLSTGEAQRLRLASFLGSSTSKRTLFIMDEPASGLHLADVRRLITSFNALIDVGHSLIVIEHNLMMMAWADHLIDLGPGPADDGGQVVATGTPEHVCTVTQSVTGRFLKATLYPEFVSQSRIQKT